ncbi:hypothetical protein ACK39B_08615 [Aeromonas veronii]
MAQQDPITSQLSWHQSLALAVRSFSIGCVNVTKSLTSNIFDSIAEIIKAATGLLHAFDAGRANLLIDFCGFLAWFYLTYLAHQSIFKSSPELFFLGAGGGLIFVFGFAGWCLNTCYLKYGRLKADKAP